MMFEAEQAIVTEAIETYQPVALMSLFSGGYDSMITTHLLHRLNTHGLPIQVWAIDTKLSADGWVEYVQGVANQYGWNFNIYDNEKGYQEFVTWVTGQGCPRTKSGHIKVFHRLKERGIDAIHMMNKTGWHDLTLFATGRRRAESADRADIPAIERIKLKNKVFCSPLVDWSNDQCDWYRVENGLPDNPFYDTVKGSGDCQCNWGNFITYRTLEKFSPHLAKGRVKDIDEISKELHGYGWDGTPANQMEMFEDFEDDSELTSPFLCEGCSRTKVRVPTHIIEQEYLQRGLF